MSKSTPQQCISAAPVLLEIRNASEVVRAGLGQTALHVRTLDTVSLAVHAGELLIVQGGVASGASTLLSTLAGTRRRVVGTRVAAPHLQILRARISESAFATLIAAWSSATHANTPAASTASPIVYLLRVGASPNPRTPVSPPTVSAHTWEAWAQALRARGGAIVAHVGHAPSAPRAAQLALGTPTAMHFAASPHKSPVSVSRRAALEPSATSYARGAPRTSSATVNEPQVAESPRDSAVAHRVRVVTLVAGRIVRTHRMALPERERLATTPSLAWPRVYIPSRASIVGTIAVP